MFPCSTKGCAGGPGVQWSVCLLWVLGWLYSSAQETPSTCRRGAYFAAWGSAAALGNSCSGCKAGCPRAGCSWAPHSRLSDQSSPTPNLPVATGAPLVPGRWLCCAARWRATVSVGWTHRGGCSTGWLAPAPPAATGVKWMPAGWWMIVLKGITDNYKTNWCECRKGLSLS